MGILDNVESGMLLQEELESAPNDSYRTSAFSQTLAKSGSRPWSKVVIAAAMLGVLVLVVTSLTLTAWRSSPNRRDQSRSVLQFHPSVKDEAPYAEPSQSVGNTEAEVVAPQCASVTDTDIDYIFAGDWFGHVDHIGSQDACCSLCAAEPKCKAWTWVLDAKLPTGNPGQCWLKGGVMKGRADKLGVVSGMSPAISFSAPGADLDVQSIAAALKERASEAAVGHPSLHANLRPFGQGLIVGEAEDGDREIQAAEAVAKSENCSALGSSCLESQCCKDAGHRCFTKNAYWAQCMVDCVQGPNPLDQVSPMPWECEALGARTRGSPRQCSQMGEDCSKSQCCTEGGTQCYEKNASFAQCKPSCSPGADLTASDWLPWSCKELGTRTMGAAPWTATQCAQPGADCSRIQCCAAPGSQCYLQSQYWGECKPACEAGEPSYPGGESWECTPKGTRTPTRADDSPNAKGAVGKWVADRCEGPYTDCTQSQCCLGVNNQCYSKVMGSWAQCKETCSTEPDVNDNNATWGCETLGPRSWGLATKAYPSLYCLSLYMPSRYEGPMLKAHLEANAGIFTCDGYDVFAAENDTLGVTKDGILEQAILIPAISVGVSQDGTAGNAKLFMAVWDKVIASGRFRNYDFTLKVDPDAVLIPWRMREHLKPHIGENAYVVNCNKFPGSPNFPMMFGAVEIFTRQAMTAYAYGSWRCGQQLPWNLWGEDYYMTHCLDFLGVGRIADFGVLGDNVCTGANCKDSYTASFHPFKDAETWFSCWHDATGF